MDDLRKKTYHMFRVHIVTFFIIMLLRVGVAIDAGLDWPIDLWDIHKS
jgi:hypothetical protein